MITSNLLQVLGCKFLQPQTFVLFFEGGDCQSAIDIVSKRHIVHSDIKEALWKSRKKGNEKKENYFQVIF